MRDTRFDHCPSVLRELHLVPPTELATFVVGSMARGWGHRFSDLDLVVVSTEPMVDERLFTLDVSLVPSTLPAIAFQRDGQRWEIKFWSDGQVDQLLEKVSWDAFENDRKIGNRMAPVEQLFLERLITCAPITGTEWVGRRREQLEDSAFRAMVITNELAKSDANAEAAMGLLASGDIEGAVLSVREAFGCAVEALLVGEGQYGALVKWRSRRFRAAAPKQLSFEEYWSIETMRTYDPADPGPWVERVFHLCKDIAAEIEI